MAECQTHATLNKIYAFLLFVLSHLVLPLPGYQVVLFSVGIGETSLQIEYQVRAVVLFLNIYFIQSRNKYTHTPTHPHTPREKAVEGCAVGPMMSWPV